MRLADVALPVPLARAFTYEIPPRFEGALLVGTGVRVLCPFGSRQLVGVVLGTREGEPPPKVRALAKVIDTVPAIPPDLLSFLRDLAAYYLAPIGEVVRLALPPPPRELAREPEERTLFSPSASASRPVGPRQVQWASARTHEGDAAPAEPQLGSKDLSLLTHLRGVGTLPVARLVAKWPNARAIVKRLEASGLVELAAREAQLDPFFTDAVARDTEHAPTDAQAAAIAAITHALETHTPQTFLLHGVTGSGKTEVYLRALAAARKLGVGGIVLVPEIALTPQLVARFRARFGDDVAVLHSGLTPRERYAMWRRLRDGELDVAIGARSALFAPVKNLGLLVVDEEHDSSFKQEEGVRYQARDMAILRAHRLGGVSVLGSATPSLEIEHLSRVGKATKLLLPGRARAQSMPRVEIVDLRKNGAGPTGDKRLSLPLHRAIEATLAANEQTILFLNRRGFSPSVLCHACGQLRSCPFCSVALTFHKQGGARLRCHYCDFEEPMPDTCAVCGKRALALEGLGTEKLEETLATAFPEARIARLDRDVATGRAVAAVLDRVRAREVDILVGTQMVTKGHDLPSVTLVGVINADAPLSIPDFRAAERGFQLLVQVAGRAGRGDVPGRVLVQTYHPEHHAIALARTHDVDGFLARELEDRRELGYPPFSRLALVRVEGPDEASTLALCSLLAEEARRVSLARDPTGRGVEVLGPSPAPLARVRSRFRFRVLLRARERAPLREVLIAVTTSSAAHASSSLRVLLDIDPVNFL